MVIGPVQARAGDDPEQPPEECLVPDVHPNRDRRLATVAAEAPLAHQDAQKDSRVEIGRD
jgi:hypothetical protein